MRARDLLKNYGTIRREEVDGRIITVLPTSTIPFEYLLEENWKRRWGDGPAKSASNSCGNFRFVWDVRAEKDGREIPLYVKHPERVFTTSQQRLEEGNIWWGGPRSGEPSPIYLRHPLVEEQTLWQAVYLLELYKQGIPAEVPVAIVEWPEGSNKLGDSELILHNVGEFPYQERFSHEDIEARVKSVGFIPEDLGGHNIIDPRRVGKSAVIDVNRWLWPPYTDEWRRELTDYIQEEVAKRDKT